MQKLKIKTKGKSYALKDSPFYNLRTKKQLSILLGCDIKDLRLLAKDDGNYNIFSIIGKAGKPRQIHKPINKLDSIHTRIASLVCRIDLPSYVHSGRKKHSNLTNAKAHLSADGFDTKVLTTDIKDFFTSTRKKQVFGFFYSDMKCTADVADLLADICTIHGHVPTGSRLSMVLAYWANYHLFEELSSLSKQHNVTMTVYVDDLTFSGAGVNELFKAVVRKVLSRYGHTMHPTKTKLYGKESPKLVTGIVVKEGQLQIRNQQLKELVTDFACWHAIRQTPHAIFDPHTYRLLGRLNSMSSIDPIFKEKAQTVKGNTCR
ncbi:reverse transcriptase family protein [Shewanella algae]|uniref:reverse transcriptase family protein n=1 Tax=Shewanella TaxID=22 RepID=UPI003006F674